MSSLEDIDRQIRDLTSEGILSRPFLCNGSPFECDIALVGINPGTDTPFWPYWNPTTGCDKDAWLEDYMRRHHHLKPSRDRIEVLCRALAPLKCLELNLWHHYSKNERSLDKQYKDTAFFDFMLEAVKPRILLVHGNKPIKHIKRILGVELLKDQFRSSTHLGLPIEIFASKRHFAYVSRDYVNSLGALLKDRALTLQAAAK